MDDALSNPTPQAPPLGGSEAAAILLMMLGDEDAAEIISHLDPFEVQHIGSAMFNVADVTQQQVESVFGLFMNRAKASTPLGMGAAPRIRAVMEHALGAERAETVLARITPPARSRALDALRWMEAKTIAAVVVHEHPQIAALVLTYLEPPIAAEVLQLLPPEMQPDVIYRVARMESVTSDAIEELERILIRDVGRVSASPTPARGGASEAAKIMNNLRPGSDQRIIRSLGKVDKQLAQRIEEEMFVFDDLSGLDEKNLGILLRNVENDVLVVAIKGAEERLRDRIFGCMSARAADTIRDEIEERGPTRLADVQEAQKEVLAIARGLADAGTIMLGGKRDDYV